MIDRLNIRDVVVFEREWPVKPATQEPRLPAATVTPIGINTIRRSTTSEVKMYARCIWLRARSARRLERRS